MSVLENLLAFDSYKNLKLKILNTVLIPNTPINSTVSVTGVPATTIFISGFLYNYIGTSIENSPYNYWDLQVALPKTCIIKSKKLSNVTIYATVICIYTD